MFTSQKSLEGLVLELVINWFRFQTTIELEKVATLNELERSCHLLNHFLHSSFFAHFFLFFSS